MRLPVVPSGKMRNWVLKKRRVLWKEPGVSGVGRCCPPLATSPALAWAPGERPVPDAQSPTSPTPGDTGEQNGPGQEARPPQNTHVDPKQRVGVPGGGGASTDARGSIQQIHPRSCFICSFFSICQVFIL